MGCRQQWPRFQNDMSTYIHRFNNRWKIQIYYQGVKYCYTSNHFTWFIFSLIGSVVFLFISRKVITSIQFLILQLLTSSHFRIGVMYVTSQNCEHYVTALIDNNYHEKIQSKIMFDVECGSDITKHWSKSFITNLRLCLNESHYVTLQLEKRHFFTVRYVSKASIFQRGWNFLTISCFWY